MTAQEIRYRRGQQWATRHSGTPNELAGILAEIAAQLAEIAAQLAEMNERQSK